MAMGWLVTALTMTAAIVDVVDVEAVGDAMSCSVVVGASIVSQSPTHTPNNKS
jgi:hypothetical protein